MTVPRPRARAGITLTEILISIMIMGVGLLSLATLFPLGIIRIRQANRASRSSLLTESAIGEIAGRGLLNKPTFQTYWYGLSYYSTPERGVAYDPFLHDPAVPNNAVTPNAGILQTVGAGLPVAYDPMWWYVVGQASGGTIYKPAIRPTTVEARFGNANNPAGGLGFIRNDPGGGPPSAYGLQRITNFPVAYPNGQFTQVDQLFSSIDDYVNQQSGAPDPNMGVGHPTVPVMTGLTVDPVFGTIGPKPYSDLSYTWMYTCRQNNVTNGDVFDGDIVVFHNRPFALDTVTPPLGNGPMQVAAGETTVEAIWGYGPPTGDPGYSVNDTTVLLRWPASMPDPEVRVGGWIADVTYERYNANLGRFPGLYPAQRCYWYRVTKRTDASTDLSSASYRSMTVTLASPVRARTLVSGSSGTIQPVHVEAALISPYVVNVYSKTFVLE
jgi:type II secretory pathway pseudopilin PulG